MQNLSEFESDSWSDLDWGYIEYGEFSASSYTAIDWGRAEFSEFESDTWSDLNWGKVEFNNEFVFTGLMLIGEFEDQYNEFGQILHMYQWTGGKFNIKNLITKIINKLTGVKSNITNLVKMIIKLQLGIKSR